MLFHISENDKQAERKTEDPSSSERQQGLGTGLEQQGFGILDADFVSRIATAVSAQLAKQEQEKNLAHTRPIVSNYQYYEKSLPLTTSDVQPALTTPPVQFDTQVFQNAMNNSFDQKRLLKLIPNPYKKSAKSLLEILDQRANELTWDSSGCNKILVVFNKFQKKDGHYSRYLIVSEVGH